MKEKCKQTDRSLHGNAGEAGVCGGLTKVKEARSLGDWRSGAEVNSNCALKDRVSLLTRALEKVFWAEGTTGVKTQR